MVAVASCFSQILSVLDRAAFHRAVREHQAERAAKGFSCWEQLVAMLFCQMGAANSLREICGGLATALGKLVHLGVRQAPTRSTLAYANAHRPWQLFETVFYDLLRGCQAVAATKRRRFRFKHPLRTLDTTIIELCASIFDWARFQRTKGAVKLHLQLDHQGCLPCWALVTDGDTTVAAIYKERWQIELFFKALKQHLKIKTFVGTTENAVQIQIWTALIAMLLLRYLQLKSTWAWSLSNLAAMLRFNLLTYRDLWGWLNAPFQVPLAEPQPEQLVLVR